jgi:hypothetical protein
MVSSHILCTGGDALMCDEVLVHKLIHTLTHSLMILALTLYLLLASGEIFLLLVTCYQSRSLHGLGLTGGKKP